MALSGSWNRPKANVVLANAIAPTFVTFEDTAATPDRQITDVYATVNGQARLLKRIIITPTYEGKQVTFPRIVLDYSAQAASTYNPASLAAATTAPFTIANGVVGKEEVDLNAFYTLAGTAPADA
jgi:hypothetical protein